MPEGALYWLGPPRVEVAGKTIRLETRKITAILSLLSVDRRPHSRERVAAMFWPEYDSKRAPANLRRALTSMQGSLGTDWVFADRDILEFHQNGDIRIDIVDFLSAIHDARDQMGGVDSLSDQSMAERLRATLALYRGDFLEGLNLRDCPEFDRWQLMIREEVVQHAAWALERLVEFDSAAGRLQNALDGARRWLALDDLNEAAHRSLMFLYARTGKRNAALHQFEVCRRLLREELDQEPDEQTLSLAERIRLRKIDSSPAAAVSSGDRDFLENSLLMRFSPPRMRAKRVERPALFEILDRGLERPLTLVSAPAGFGKTTLLCEWIQSRKLPVAWLSLEEGDEAPAGFLSAIATALSSFGEGMGAEALQMLRAVQSPPLVKVVDSLIRDLNVHPAFRILVLDDFHLITHPDTQKLVMRFGDHMPEGMHLFIATRVDPALPLAKLRAGDLLVEIRADDLRFSVPEANTFLSEVMGLTLDGEDIETLERRTEGWPAGLQMVALSLQGRTDCSEFIRNFSGSHRYIMDYLLGEVLNIQPPEIQEFLLKTSILKRFRASLCEAVTGQENAQSVLEELDKGNLFMVSLDDRRIWYRYHHLFSELLRHHLNHSLSADEIAVLHERAGIWLEGEGDDDEAMHHYLTGGHYGRALDFMDRNYESILTVGKLGTLLDWAKRVPPEEVLRSAAACVTIGTLYVWAGNEQQAENYSALAREVMNSPGSTLTESERDHLNGRIATIRGFTADLAGRTEEALELAHEAERFLPPEDKDLRPLIPYMLGKIYRYEGELDKAEQYLSEMLRVGLSIENSWTASAAVHELFWIYRFRGRLREAIGSLEIIESMPKEPGSEGPIAKIFADRGELEREWGDLEAAEKDIRKSLTYVERWGLPSDLYFCYVAHCRLELSLGNIQSAEEALIRALGVRNSYLIFSTLIPQYEVEQVRVWIIEGKSVLLSEWIKDCPADRKTNPLNREMLLIAKARAFLALERLEEAVSLLHNLATEAEAGGRYGRLLEMHMLRALVERTLGNEMASFDFIGQALDLAAGEGYRRIFLDEGQPMVDLLNAYVESSSDDTAAAVYARRLIDTSMGR